MKLKSFIAQKIVAMEDLTSDGTDLDFREFEGAVGRSPSAFSSTPEPGRGVMSKVTREGLKVLGDRYEEVDGTSTNVGSGEILV